MKLKIKHIVTGEGGAAWMPRLPRYATTGAAGMDLAAAQECILQPGQILRIPTGIGVEIPEGYEGQVRPRSGLSSRGIIAILGTVDSDYRGEIHVLLENRSREPVVITPGMRIAQLVIAPVVRVQVEVVAELSDTERGAQGFGSTGVSAIQQALDAAPVDEEPLTEAEIRELDEAEAEEGPRYSSDEVKRILGLEEEAYDDEALTPEDIEAIEEAKAETGPFRSLAEVLERRRNEPDLTGLGCERDPGGES